MLLVVFVKLMFWDTWYPRDKDDIHELFFFSSPNAEQVKHEAYPAETGLYE